MLKYVLLSALIAIHTVWTAPVQHHGELTPHILIVTPQAQLQLETLAHGTPIIQHLSPFTRFVAPHEETIVYVPTNALAGHSLGSSVVPTYQYEARTVPQGSTKFQEDLRDASFFSHPTYLAQNQLIPVRIVETLTDHSAVGGVSPKIAEVTPRQSQSASLVSSTIKSVAKVIAANKSNISDFIKDIRQQQTNGDASISPNKISDALAIGTSLQGQIADSLKKSESTARQGGFESIATAISNPSEIINTISNAATNANQAFETITNTNANEILNTVTNSIQNAVQNAVQNSVQNNPCDTLNSIAANAPTAIPAPPAIGSQASTQARSFDKQEIPANSAQLPLTKIQHVEYEIPITPILATEPRHQLPHYAGVIGPALPHVVDFIQTPIFLAPSIPTIKGRSLEPEAADKPIAPLPTPETPQPEVLPLKPELEGEESTQAAAISENIKEIKSEIGRSLDANTLKEGQDGDLILPEKTDTLILETSEPKPEEDKLKISEQAPGQEGIIPLQNE